MNLTNQPLLEEVNISGVYNSIFTSIQQASVQKGNILVKLVEMTRRNVVKRQV